MRAGALGILIGCAPVVTLLSCVLYSRRQRIGQPTLFFGRDRPMKLATDEEVAVGLALD